MLFDITKRSWTLVATFVFWAPQTLFKIFTVSPMAVSSCLDGALSNFSSLSKQHSFPFHTSQQDTSVDYWTSKEHSAIYALSCNKSKHISIRWQWIPTPRRGSSPWHPTRWSSHRRSLRVSSWTQPFKVNRVNRLWLVSFRWIEWKVKTPKTNRKRLQKKSWDLRSMRNGAVLVWELGLLGYHLSGKHPFWTGAQSAMSCERTSPYVTS